MKTLLDNDSIRKEFVKKTFQFFVENWAGRLVLKKIVTIGLGIVGVKKWTQTAKDAFVSNVISNIVTNKWKFLSAPSSLISAFTSFGGIVEFFFDWIDGKWNSYATIKIP